ncbi:MAG TPA: hypothetical protein VN918_09630 [Myxococcaceae bacterium]|nr:hypothetical protein [Myxococcaceae bacterium]
MLFTTSAVAQRSSSPPGAASPAASPESGASASSSSSDAPKDLTFPVEGRPAPVVEQKSSPDQDSWYSLYRGKKFGLQLDAGAPEGAGLLVLFRPFSWLRANAGFAYNVMGSGIRGGLTLIPFHWGVTPTLNLDVGHYFSGDLNKFVTASNAAEHALLSNAAYDFWSAQIGLEFGSQDGFLFYLRGGIVHIGATLPGRDVAAFMNSHGTTGFNSPGDGQYSALLPCVSLGFMYYIF